MSNEEVNRLERDVVFLYHQLAEYGAIMGDLDYERTFNQPYWEWLELEGGDNEDLIHEGCLVMILAMIEALDSAADSHLLPFQNIVLQALELC